MPENTALPDLDTTAFEYVVDRAVFDHAVARFAPGMELEPRIGLGLGPTVPANDDDRAYLLEHPEAYGGSWLGGVPTERTPWPEPAPGQPHLPFILQIDFTDTFNNVGEWRYCPGAPTYGTLAFFHDTVSLGDPDDTPEDRPWRFVWSDEPAEPGFELPSLLPTPFDVDPELVVPQTSLDIDSVVTVRDPFTAPLSNEGQRGLYHRLWEEFEYDAWARIFRAAGPRPATHPGDLDFAIEEPMSRMFGWGACELRDDQLEPVLEGLGASSVDELVLLLELNPRTFEGLEWFHGCPLQVWMFRADLEAGNFENTWCIIRTDS